ncbi:MAG: hypothetical protein OMM_04787 [Candidatus Magnetoglobus multicellularis str. Araruama]|uniref:Pesticidal crystal protein Cry22Aa Ig-like domain-containing protein n=1 Tax=Candidatus Magnetoglobus multicellularis str. Araruama TaxID=890399 RepID=A0A1V1NZL4_9BACT|nr:MAG: hypothetical protein OMM_04787 [Candidatus Magnetoglobus multicellularis str. Araruama]
MDDPDSETLSISLKSSNQALVNDHQLAIHGVGEEETLIIQPAENAVGAVSITIQVDDGYLMAQQSFMITITSVNDAPIAMSQVIETNENQPVDITLIAQDVDTQLLTFSIVSQGEKGSVDLVNSHSGKVVYQPDDSVYGTDRFLFSVSDEESTSVVTEVIVIIISVNGDPAASAGMNQQVDERSVCRLDASRSIDADGEIVSYLWSQLSGPTVTLSDMNVVMPEFTVPSAEKGQQEIVFQLTVIDNENAQSTDQVQISIIDKTSPLLNLVGDNPQIIEIGETYKELGATATDRVDGDLSSTISIQNNITDNLPGTYQVRYEIKDSSDNWTYVLRDVLVQDTTPPIIQLSGPSQVSIEVFSDYVDSGATVTDNYDEEYTLSLKDAIHNFDNQSLGTYEVKYKVSDSMGNTSATVVRTVRVIDTTKPVLTLIGEPIDKLIKGNEYKDAGAVVIDNYDLNIQQSLSVTQDVNADQLGTYKVVYNATDVSGNSADEIFRYVVVYETKTGTVQGTVIDEYNQPLSQVVIALTDATDFKPVQTDTMGRFTIENLPLNRKYYFNFSLNNYVDVDKCFTGSESFENIVMVEKENSGFKYIVGTCRHSDGSAIKDVSVSLESPDYETSALTDKNGSFSLSINRQVLYYTLRAVKKGIRHTRIPNFPLIPYKEIQLILN